jgi:hypothetical protein
MRKSKYLVGLAVIASLTFAALPSAAQDNSNVAGEIIVTAQRASADYLDDEQPVLGLRKQADSAVQSVQINSDSREEATRKREIHAMLESAINRASGAGVQLVTGDFDLVSVTLANYKELIFRNGNRPDMSTVSFYVKSKLAGSTGSAQGRIDTFIKSVPASGRSLMEKQGGLTLTIINPDQYRESIVKLIASESLKYASYFGPDYGVEVVGLNEQLSWAQASGTEVFLYIPYRFVVKPK